MLSARWLLALAAMGNVAAQSLLAPRNLCGASLKVYQFIDYNAIYGTGGVLC